MAKIKEEGRAKLQTHENKAHISWLPERRRYEHLNGCQYVHEAIMRYGNGSIYQVPANNIM